MSLEQRVDEHVDAAQEEAGDRRDVVQRFAPAKPVLQAIHVGIDDLTVTGQAEEQRDVDVDAFRGQQADGRQALAVCRGP